MNESEQKRMVKVLKALANPIRLRMLASLYEEPKTVYNLAKELDLPYPLAHLHLKSLKMLSLVKEVRREKRAEGMPTIKYYAPSDFDFSLTPKTIRELYTGRSGGEKNG